MEIKTLLFSAVITATTFWGNQTLAQDIVLESDATNSTLFDADGSGLNIENNDAMNIGGVGEGDYVKYTGVDLTNIISFNAEVAKNQNGDRIIKMHLDNGSGAPGTEVGSITYNGKRGWQTYEESETAILTQTVAGVQDIYFVFSGGFLNIDFFTLKSSTTPPPIMIPETLLQSSDHDGIFDADASGNLNIESNTAMNLGSTGDGDWIRFDNVDLTSINEFYASVGSNRNNNNTTITMHLENTTTPDTPGVAIGSLTSTGSTGGWQNYIDSDIASVTPTTGTHDIFFVLTGAPSINIDYFAIRNNSTLSSTDVKNNNNVSFYPNPVTNVLNANVSSADYSNYAIVDINGSTIKTGVVTDNLQVNVEDLSQGVYIVSLTGNKNYTFKFVKK